MKKINGKYVASATEKSRAMAHARKLAMSASYAGIIEVLFDNYNGRFDFIENVGNSYTEHGDCYDYVGAVRT